MKNLYILTNKKESARYPTDEEFCHELVKQNIFPRIKNNDIKKYLFERFENGALKDGPIGLWNKLDSGNLNIEHIMPQTLTDNWKKHLGSDFQRIHDTWLHRLANLTLIEPSNNSSFGNKTFLEKRDMDGGFDKSGLHLNWWIKKQNKWTEDELNARSADLQKEALKLWPQPESPYMPPLKRQQNRITFEESDSLTGRVITKYSFLEVEQSVDSWATMIQEVLKQLHDKEAAIINSLIANPKANDELSSQFSISPDNFSRAKQIDENLYVRTGTDTKYKINMLKKLLPLYNIELDELVFYLSEDKNMENS